MYRERNSSALLPLQFCEVRQHPQDHMADQLVIRVEVLFCVALEVDPQPVELLEIEYRFRNTP